MKTNGTRVALLGSLLLLPCLLLLTASGDLRDSAQQDLKNYPGLSEPGEIWCSAKTGKTVDIVVIRDSKS